MMKSGVCGTEFILSTAARRVAVTSGLAGLLKPIWLSLIWTKLKLPLLSLPGFWLGNPGDPEQRSGLIPNTIPVIANSVPI